MSKFELEITKITVLIHEGTDIIYIHTDLPNPFIPAAGYNTPLCLKCEATWNTGVDYVQAVFGIDPEVIDTFKLREKVEPKLEKEELPHGADAWEEVTSSNILAIGKRGEDLFIQFKNGATYCYPKKAQYYTHLMESDSKGRAFFRIKAALTDYVKV